MEGRAVRIRVDHNVGELAAALQRAPAIVMQEVDRGAGRGALALGRTARDLAFVIGRKIARDGTAAQPFMGPALEASQDTLRATMAAASQAGVRRAFA
jgi:hypothetical protein